VSGFREPDRRVKPCDLNARKLHVKGPLALAAAVTIAAAPLAAPAQPAGAAWRGDVCQQQQRAAGAHGGFLGALVGGLFGWTLAGRGNRAAGAAVGGGAGAVAGDAIGRSQLECLPYPPRIQTHEHNCRWVAETYGDAPHQFEACREPDGAWRPSGRS
jgi:uncharacterized protein YcfJ